jgi:hypothetical protein
MSRRRKEKSGRHNTDEPERSVDESSRLASERYEDRGRGESRDDIEIVASSRNVDFIEWT